jgi:hypothetical protein
MRRYFLEPVDSGNGKHAGFLVDFQFVPVGSLNFFTARESDYEHWRSSRIRGLFVGGPVLAGWLTRGALILGYDFLSRLAQDPRRLLCPSGRGVTASSRVSAGYLGKPRTQGGLRLR